MVEVSVVAMVAQLVDSWVAYSVYCWVVYLAVITVDSLVGKKVSM